MNQGDLVFVKSSEEPVIVLATDGVVEHPSQTVDVRRPIIGQDGTRYEMFTFFRCELETAEERDLRKIDDIKRQHRLTQNAVKDAGPDTRQFDMFAESDPGAIKN